MAEVNRCRYVNYNESEQEFENLLRRSPGAKLFFNLPPRRPEANTSSVSSLSDPQSKSCRNGPLLSPLSKILKQMHRPYFTESAVKGNIALNNGYGQSSSKMPPPRTTFVYHRKGDTPDEPKVTLKRLHKTALLQTDTPTRFSEDDLGGEEEDLEEVEQEDDNKTEEEEVIEQPKPSDDVLELETGNVTKQGKKKNGRSRPKKSLQEKEVIIPEDKELDTSRDAFIDKSSERTTAIHQKGKNYRDIPPNVDMNDVIAETVMDQWYLTQPRKRIIVIEGHRIGDPEDELWHSSSISKRLSPRLLVTASGSRYRVQGPINIEMTLEHGFSAELVKKFLKGFPADWKEIIQEQCLKSEKLSSDTTGKEKSKHPTGQEANGANHKKKKMKQDRIEKPTPVTTGKKKSSQKTKREEPESQSEIKSTPNNARSETSSAAFKTPRNITPTVLAVDDLHRSRSGRRLLPPLAYWTGERIRPNYRLDKVEIIEGSPDYTGLLSNTPKLVGLESDKENVKTKSNMSLRRRKSVEKKSGSSKSKLNKTKDGSVAKQPKRKKEPTRSKTGQIVAKDEKVKSKVRDKMEVTGGSMQSKRRGSSKVCDDKTKRQTEKQNNEKQEEKDDDRDKNDVETDDDDDEEVEAPYWSRKSTRRRLRRDANTDTKDEEHEHDDLKEKNLQETMNKRVTRGQSSRKNANKRVGENVSIGSNVLEERYGGKGTKGEKNGDKQQRIVSQPRRDAGLSPAETSEQPQTSDTESAKQEKEMQRIAKQDTKKQVNGNTSFDLYGDILGILAKQKQKRHERRSQDIQHSFRYQRTSSEASHTDESDEDNEIRDADNPRKVTDRVSDNLKGDITSDCKVERTGSWKTGGTWTSKKKKMTSIIEKPLVGSFQQSPDAWSSQDRIQPVEEVKQPAECDDDSIISSNQRRSERREEVRGSYRTGSAVLQEEEKDGPTKERTVSKTKDDMKKTKTQKGSRRTRKAKKVAEKENNQDEDAWTLDEIERLQRAMRSIKPSTNNFWEKISEEVGTRDEEECRIQHQSSLDVEKTKTGQDRKPMKIAKKAPVTINAKKGTLKRKRQLRELAEHHNMGFEEDLFDATPYRKVKKSKVLLSDSSDDEDSEAPVSNKTPSLTMPNFVPFSTKKTPHTNWTPGLLQSVNRNKAEEYIYRMQKRKNLAKQKSTPLVTRPLSKTGKKQNKFQNRFNDREVQEAFDVKEITEEEDSGEEKDYYWSEEEDAVAT